MISYFPQIYDDELMYSLLARAYIHSGFSSYKQFSLVFFGEERKTIDIEMLNVIVGETDIEIDYDNILDKNTLFNFYCMFDNPVVISKAKEMVLSGDKAYRNTITFEASGKERFLKYCPKCVEKDRKTFGETYWHRSHQISSSKICTKHRCYLMESNISMSGKRTPMLYHAEQIIPENREVIFCENKKEIEAARYIEEVFNTNNYNYNVTIADFLRYVLKTKGYTTNGQGFVRRQRLVSEMQKYYADTSYIEYIIDSRIEKILNGKRFNFTEICLLSFFLNISTNELADRKIEEEIIKPRKHDRKSKGGVKKKDWSNVDRFYLPKVINAINEIKAEIKPKRVTVFAIEKMIGLPSKALYNMPLCMEEIKANEECQERFWARKLIWAYEDTLNSGETMCWRRLRDRTNLRREDVTEALGEIKKIAGDELMIIIRGLLYCN